MNRSRLYRKLAASIVFALVARGASASIDVEKIVVQNSSPKIVGGVEATPGEFPFIVSLQTSNWGHFCGGSLVRPNWVLTAAHCAVLISNPEKLNVVIGLHSLSNLVGTETIIAKQIIVHPEYKSKTDNDFDFALIELKKASTYLPIAINQENLLIPDSESEAPMGIVTGWGAQRENGTVASKLQKVNVPFVSDKQCELAYPKEITDRMICAGLQNGGKDSCQGDSGGPLLTTEPSGERLLAGVVSWGEGCARAKKYGVYGKVSSVSSWIGTVAVY